MSEEITGVRLTVGHGEYFVAYRKGSSHNARGYTQVIPKRHEDKINGRDIHDTHVNIQVGLKVLGDCFKRHKELDYALGCYNGTSNPNKISDYKDMIYSRKKKILQLASI